MVYRDFFVFSIFACAFILVLSLFHIDKNVTYNLSIWLYSILGIIFNIIFINYTKNKKLSTGSVLIFGFFIGFFYLIINNFIFYINTNSFFEFEADDSMHYQKIAILINESKLSNAVKIMHNYKIGDFNLQIDDYGAPIYVALVYKFVESNIAVNIINLILSLSSVLLIYKSLYYFINYKTAIIASIIYQTLSFHNFFTSSGLKEPILMFFCSLGFFFVFLFSKSKKKIYLLLFLLSIFPLIYFRAVLFFVLVVSLLFGLILGNKKSFFSLFIIFIGLASFLIIFPNLDLIYRFIYYIPKIFIVAENEAGFVSSIGEINLLIVSFISAFIGPLPTFIPTESNLNNSIFSVGLLLKVMLFPFFIISFKYVYKTKNLFLVFSSIFIFIKMLSLGVLLDSFELRRHLSHLPLFIILAFIGYNMYTQGNLKFKYSKIIFQFYVLLIIPFLLTWNILRI